MKDTDVLVVGAGPTGLTLAAALISRGIRVAVVDKLAAGANTSRAAAVNARTLEVLEELDVARRMVKAGLIAPRFTMRQGRRILIPVDFSELPTEHPYTLMLSQADTERLLLERLHELGGDVVRPKALGAITQDANGVTATFDDGDTISAGYAVGTDGMHSTVRAQAGIGFAGGEFAESFALADVRVTGEAPRNEVILFYAKDGLTVLAPLPGDIFRVVAPTTDAPQLPSAEFVQALLDARGFGPRQTIVTELVWGSRFHIHHRVADSYRAGRLLLAGDAAHVHSPAGGQGMNLGITDAVALAGALAEVLAGGSDAALDAYSTAQRRRAERVLKLTGRLTRVATLPRPLRPLRNTGMRLAAGVPAVRRQLAVQLSGLSAE
ncbi:FAD-dependent oxidoreductase [Mycobacterium nebraskense]|uniref:Pentachlorophenol monooxygenase n=1 Tax=Mycobacterium nebraskense TaxID=244292 RepID=A0A0F5N9H5_9MYCO|nr:FAD-dependent oxidoreductase [Mycobacterium nebraskense]KKC03681.1 pentachlorophenol monooxygenase [Mycobacterium nebraskense]KLO34557.1 pentachlorophenol monooxygenase [Mycobacterium nebraskense]MBI2693330.1 FAD-dependent monooxygenase [Mycobacterium nebraskense]MCV7119594.1 FAD-dependent monooxygenase [Mycobacterium nebraskense]ORW31771.1 pentachlorophenol monooxygenase [Mycobacterium nebraskense]